MTRTRGSCKGAPGSLSRSWIRYAADTVTARRIPRSTLLRTAVTVAGASLWAASPGLAAVDFAPRATIPTDDPPTVVAVADVTGDQVPDLLRGSLQTRDLIIHTGLGGGTVASGVGIAVGETVGAIATGDFDEDGDRDIVTANGDRSLKVLTLGPRGAVEGSATITVGGAPSAIAQGDLNADGHVDLVVVNVTSRSASVVLGRGPVGFDPSVFIDIGDFAVDAVLADITEDGRLDIVAAVQRPAGVTVTPGNGDGTFGRPTRLGAGLEPSSVGVADFDRDGHLDLVAANQLSNEVTMRRGIGGGRFVAGRRTLTSSLPADMAIGDWNDDGYADIATANSGSNDVSILENTGRGLFRSAQQFRVGRTPTHLVSGDATGDGRADLLVANTGGTTLTVLSPRPPQSPGTAVRRTRCPTTRLRAITTFESRCVALTMSQAQVTEVMGRRVGSRRIDRGASVRWHYRGMLVTFSQTFNFVTNIRTSVPGARTAAGVSVGSAVGDLSRRLDPESAFCRTAGPVQSCTELDLFTLTEYHVVRGKVTWIEISLSSAIFGSLAPSNAQLTSAARVVRSLSATRRARSERGNAERAPAPRPVRRSLPLPQRR